MSSSQPASSASTTPTPTPLGILNSTHPAKSPNLSTLSLDNRSRSASAGSFEAQQLNMTRGRRSVSGASRNSFVSCLSESVDGLDGLDDLNGHDTLEGDEVGVDDDDDIDAQIAALENGTVLPSPTRASRLDKGKGRARDSHPASATHSPGQSPMHSPRLSAGSIGSDDDELDSDTAASEPFDFEFDDYEEADDEAGASDPLVRPSRRKKWEEEGGEGDRGLLELIAPLIIAHPMALFPVLASVPYNFLPAGVALFIPIFCLTAALSMCAHIVIIYLAWYLKVRSFEEVFARCVGERFGKYGLAVGRAFVLVSTIGTSVGWVDSLYPLIQPIPDTYFPKGILQSRALWTVLASALLIPSLVPSRSIFKGAQHVTLGLALLLPVTVFIAIGRTVEVKKAADEIAAAATAAGMVAEAVTGGDAVSIAGSTPTEIAAVVVKSTFKTLKRGIFPRGLNAGSAGAGLTTITMFFTSHLMTLPIHASLARATRQKFAVPGLAATIILVVLGLPFVLVPYYLLPQGYSVFDQLPADDGWVNFARLLMCLIILGSINMWLLHGRDTILSALDIEGGERYKAGRWFGLGMWTVVVLCGCIGGVLADKIELLGVIATLAIGWLLPSVFFIITFHVRSPLAIIFPSNAPPPALPLPESSRPRSGSTTPRAGRARASSLDDPSADLLLARKERQLQKRRLGRRLWQDMVVYVGILPVGCVCLAWTVGAFLSLW